MPWGGFTIFVNEIPMLILAVVRSLGKKLLILILFTVVAILMLVRLQLFSQKSPELALTVDPTFHPDVKFR